MNEQYKEDYLDRKEARGDMRMEKFTFFWHTASPFSQWHPADFIVNGVQYTSAEQ
ncbi:hypothetical protein [Paenibacillus barcinonensis]|uniref:hypothetical protein n=1 Tax=Paenibacillus barcinonensis TaxID=198119 RepID=UPI0031452171